MQTLYVCVCVSVLIQCEQREAQLQLLSLTATHKAEEVRLKSNYQPNISATDLKTHTCTQVSQPATTLVLTTLQ